ncbi:MAG: manganese efflux pump, partial [Bacteroidales bacterium]|nr:manganese efflux pump [Bacteroidales bacterium]
WVICTLAIATSIDAFVVGIGFGLNSAIKNSLFTCLIIAAVTMLVSMVGVFLGKRSIPIPEKWATILAGVVLIGLGTHTLLEHLLS